MFLVLVSIQCAWLVARSLYRLYLSPLSNIPGPKLAALTSWYEFYYDVIRPGQYVFKIKELHETYGPIIRVTPDEVHVNDITILDTIYTAPNVHRRDKDRAQLRGLDVGMSTSGTAAHDLHRKRRAALSPFFVTNSVTKLRPLIAAKVAYLCQHLDSAQLSGVPINLYDLYYALARDVVFEYSFGKPSNLLSNLEAASRLRKDLTQLLRGVKLSKSLYPLPLFLKFLPSRVINIVAPPGMKSMRETAKAIGEQIQEILDDRSDARMTNYRSIFRELRDNDELPDTEKTQARLQSEGTMLIMAGTESTAKVIGIIHYHLLGNAKMLHTLRMELGNVSLYASPSELQRLPYLSAICSEGSRLAFGLTGRNIRKAPDEAIQYKSYTLPPGTAISMSTLCIHTDESIFPDPWRFDPGRWLGEEGKQRQKYHYGFGRGSRMCLGIELAKAELFLTVAAVARYNMELFDTGAEDVEFRHDFQVAHPKLDSKGIRALVLGKAQRLGSR